MKELSTEAKVGLLTLVVIIALMVVNNRLSETKTGGASKGPQFYVKVPSAEGLGEKTPIKIAGVPVGVIEKVVRTDDGQAELIVRLDPDVQLPLDSKIIARSSSLLTGDKQLVLIPGAATEGPSIPPGTAIPYGGSEADLSQVIQHADAIAKDLQNVSASLRETLGTAEGQAKLQGMLDDLSKFSANLEKMTSENREALHEVVENLRTMSERLNQVIDHSGNDLDQTFVEVKKAAAKLDSSLASIDSVAGKIDRGEGTIGRLINDDETVENLNEAIGGINDIVERVNRIHIFVNYEGEFQVARADGQTDQMLNELNLRIAPHPDYGYIVGVTSDPNGSLTITDTTDTYTYGSGRPGTSITTREEKTTFGYLWNLQMYKRWGHVGGRIGIKESSGGIGADLWALDDKLKLSVDAFQFLRETSADPGGAENPRIKVGVRYDVFNHLFLVGGGDDLISNYKRQAYYLGAGFEFNDDDLKFIAGSIPIPK